MKRAPVIPKHTVNTPATETPSSAVPAAPMVDSLIARVGAMARGNSIVLPACGREVRFSLEVIPVILLRATPGSGQATNVIRNF